jgi:hypothetical protein
MKRIQCRECRVPAQQLEPVAFTAELRKTKKKNNGPNPAADATKLAIQFIHSVAADCKVERK